MSGVQFHHVPHLYHEVATSSWRNLKQKVAMMNSIPCLQVTREDSAFNHVAISGRTSSEQSNDGKTGSCVMSVVGNFDLPDKLKQHTFFYRCHIV